MQTSAPTPISLPKGYRGRFAPSPTGPLHLGSLVAALASWLDARAADGTWLVRMEDLDPPREQPGAAAHILKTLACFELVSDETVVFQSRRGDRYEAALQQLRAAGLLYTCSCSRQMIDQAAQAQGLKPGVYAGTCRQGAAKGLRQALRLKVENRRIEFTDRAAGLFSQNLANDVGDFVLRRADGLWAYQLAVVVDDEAQGITHVVRGADLLDNTPRQIVLQSALGYRHPRYLHVPVVTNAAGEKLSKQTKAAALSTDAPLCELELAWQHLGFETIGADSVTAFLRIAVQQWRARWFQAG